MGSHVTHQEAPPVGGGAGAVARANERAAVPRA
jgi:hypothetical protein